MTKTSRDELLLALRELSSLFPDWRFGQLVANVATAARGPQVESIWDSEDDELLAAAQRLLEQNRDRNAHAAPGQVDLTGLPALGKSI